MEQDHALPPFNDAAWMSLLSKVRQRCLPDQELTTALPQLSLYHMASPSPVVLRFFTPSIAVILQGEKTVMIGDTHHRLGEGAFLLASIDMPTFAQVSAASRAAPYLSLVVELDMQLVRHMLASQVFPEPGDNPMQPGLCVGTLNHDLLHVFERMLVLLDRPAEIAVMSDLLLRELIFRLLLCPEGSQLRQLARADGQVSRVSHAIDWLRDNYTQPFSMRQLAQRANMGVSTLHHRFRELTSMSPLQYQKNLRLHAARKLMLEQRVDASNAALQVGYESAAQFSREYRRFFGAPPSRDIKTLRGLAQRQT